MAKVKKTAVKSTTRDTQLPLLNPEIKCKHTYTQILTSKPTHIFEKKDRSSSKLYQTSLSSPIYRKIASFFSFSPIKVIMCQRGKSNVSMIMTVKDKHDSL